MTCKQCQALENLFDDRMAESDLKDLRRRGPSKTTRMLIEALVRRGVIGKTALDIGAGVGAVHLALLSAGAVSATDVDVSGAYLKAAKGEATRLGLADHTRYIQGDFVQQAENIEPADVVTLDRVVCCYPDMQALVGASVAHARSLYGLIFPRDIWWMRWGAAVGNLFPRLMRSGFQFYVHRTARVDAIARDSGFERVYTGRTALWQVIVYGRPQPATSAT
jgi:magnesium-protoporphyrin O-methyltransferase